MRRSFLTSGLVVAALASGANALAQGAREVRPAPVEEAPGVTPASTTPMAVPEDLLRTTPGGLTADQVGQRAMETSFAAKQSIETMRAAQARVEAAWAGFLPRVSGVAKYTRLNNITYGSLTPQGENIV